MNANKISPRIAEAKKNGESARILDRRLTALSFSIKIIL